MSLEEYELNAEKKAIDQIVPEINESQNSKENRSKQYYFQVDVMKTICIICVVPNIMLENKNF